MSKNMNTIIGTDGSDKLKGTNGDDILIGGKGNDILTGGRGNDTYIFSKGDGQDQIINYASDGNRTTDTVKFTDVTFNDVQFYRSGNNLVLIYSNDGSDAIQLTDFFRGAKYEVNVFEFADGTTFTAADVNKLLRDAPNTLFGTAGNDRITGTNGDDVLIGGKGNDTLTGGRGNDTYIFSKGDGQDTVINYASDGDRTTDIVKLTDVGFDDVEFFRDGRDLVLVYSEDASDKILLKDFFRGSKYEVNKFEFADGTTLSAAEVTQMLDGAPNTIHGTDGNDRITGTNGDDILIGGKGNDILKGGRGNDTYVFSKGDGQDTVINYASDGAKTTDVVKFTDVKVGEAEFIRQENDLVIIYSDDHSDQILLKDFFRGAKYEVNRFEFTDGTWTVENVYAVLDKGPNTYYGTDGDDKIKGTNGDDILIGGKGNDTLTGGKGNDTYIFRKGDGGIDTVVNYASDGARTTDTAVFEGVLARDARLYRQGNDLIITYSKDSQDRVHFKDFFRGAKYEVDRFVFDDFTFTGRQMLQGMKDADSTYFGTDGNDKIRGGLTTNNVLIGGKGDDTLIGGCRNDTFVFSKGDGTDTVIRKGSKKLVDIVKFTNVDSTEAKLYRSGRDLVIVYSDDGSDKVILKDYLRNDKYAMHEIHFQDRTYRFDDVQELLAAGSSQGQIAFTEDVGAPTVNQELHSLLNAMASFTPATNEDLIAGSDVSLSQPLITTSAY